MIPYLSRACSSLMLEIKNAINVSTFKKRYHLMQAFAL